MQTIPRPQNSNSVDISRIQARSTANFMNQVYLWMTLGLLITSLVSFGVARDLRLMTLLNNKVFFIGQIILQFAAVIGLTAFIHRMSAALAKVIYLAYAASVGIIFSSLFWAFTMNSIAAVFALTTFSFAGLSMFGLVTKRDLGPVGSFCMMGLFGLVGFYLIGLLFPSMMSSTAQMMASVVGVIVFAGLTAYDTQKIKALNAANAFEAQGQEITQKAAIHGALILYLDFINLFLNLLRLFGDRK